MKKKVLIHQLFFIVISVLFSGCDFKELGEGEWVSTTEKAPTAELTVTPNSLGFGPNDDTRKPLVINSNVSWHITLSNDWCHVSSLSGTGSQELTVYCDNNTTNKDRNDVIRIISSSLEKPRDVPVFQSATLYYLNATVKNIQLDGRKDETAKFQVQSNTKWSIKSLHSLGTLSQNGDEITLTVKRNTTALEKKDTIIVSSVEIESLADTIYVRQTAGEDPYLIINPESLNYENQGGVQKFTISTNVEWNLSLESNKDWCQITSDTSGDGSTEIFVFVSKNAANQPARDAILMIKSSAGNKTLKIHQAAGDPGYLSASPNTINLNATADTLDLKVESNLDVWTVEMSNSSWCKLLTTEGSFDGTIQISVERNTSSEVRTATVTIKSSNEPVKVTITQDVLQTPGGDDNPNPHYSRKL